MTLALLSLGSNIEPEKHLRAAAADLREAFPAIRFSPVYRTPAVGFEGEDFLNAAAALHADADAIELDRWLHALESRHGRVRGPQRFASRTLDVDIVFFGDQVIQGPGHLHIPRDELKYEFVLRPLADIAPDFRHPLLVYSLAEQWDAWMRRQDGYTESEMVEGMSL